MTQAANLNNNFEYNPAPYKHYKIASILLIVLTLIMVAVTAIIIYQWNNIIFTSCSYSFQNLWLPLAVKCLFPLGCLFFIYSSICLIHSTHKLAPTKSQTHFIELNKHFHSLKLKCLRNVHSLRLSFSEPSAFPGLQSTLDDNSNYNKQTKAILETGLALLPSMHSRLMYFAQTLGYNHKNTLELYKECMEISSNLRDLAILIQLEVENFNINTNNINTLINPVNNPLSILLFYPEAIATIFEKEIDSPDSSLTLTNTKNFSELQILSILEASAANHSTASPLVRNIKQQSLLQLKLLLYKIDHSEITTHKPTQSWLMELAKNNMAKSTRAEYSFALNTIISSLFYHFNFQKTHNYTFCYNQMFVNGNKNE